MRGLYIAAIALHLLAAAAWIGGLLAFALVAMPVFRRDAFRAVALDLIEQMGLRLRAVGWLALGTLAVTGVFQATQRAGGAGNLLEPAFWTGAWGRLLALKLALFAGLVALASWHDFAIGPRVAAVARARPDSAEAQRLRRRAGRVGRINVVLSVVLLLLGVFLVRGLP
ncbi:MAG: CopD family protein [Deltaproteobacteria bacterium]|nr:MAG: CopD family protein [Deltaproteobacteria bacterium]